MAESPRLGGIAARAFAALLLVFGTYNPEGFSYFHWAIAPMRTGIATAGPASVKVLVGIVLIGAWGVFINATRRSIGIGGALLIIGLAACLTWVLMDFGVVSASSSRGITHVVLFCTAMLLAVGMNWSHLQRRLSGQVDMDPTD
jgi:hypothetical protein